MIRLLVRTLLIAVVMSPALALIVIALDLSEAQRRLLAAGAGIYLFITYYYPRAVRLWWMAQRIEENQMIDEFNAEREQRKDE